MNINEYLDLLDELDDEDGLEAFFQFDAQRSRHPKGRISKKLEAEEQAFISAQDDSSASFSFTYQASLYESGWMLDSLGPFYEQKWISDVLRLIKGGKEASVYLCKSGQGVPDPFVVAKVYRPRIFRNLKNDHLYRVGRQDLDESGNAIFKDGDVYAISKRTAYGEKLRHQSWIAYEYQALQRLFEAGISVPRPFAMGNNAILMAYIGDLDSAAPTLQSVDLQPAEGEEMFARILEEIEIMLRGSFIHADLSAYNILYWNGSYTIIDFPQVVSPAENPAAWNIFLRDVTRVCQYFASQGVASDPQRIASRLWTSSGYRIVKDIHPRYLDAENDEDRKLWEKQIS